VRRKIRAQRGKGSFTSLPADSYGTDHKGFLRRYHIWKSTKWGLFTAVSVDSRHNSHFDLKIQQLTIKAVKHTTIVGNRLRGRPKGSKSKKNTSSTTGSAIQEAPEVHELNATDEAEERPKKQSRRGTKNQPPEQPPKEAHERRQTTPINLPESLSHDLPVQAITTAIGPLQVSEQATQIP